MVNRENDNFGAYLQAFALKWAIEKFTLCESVVLPIERDRFSRKLGGGNDLLNNLSLINKKRKALFVNLRKKRRLELFHRWLLKNATEGVDFFPPAKIHDHLIDVDTLVVGSDSVWFLREDELNLAPDQLSQLRRIFFGWLPANRELRRVAYAASQGVGVPIAQSSLIKSSIWNFDAISVRETESVEYIRNADSRVSVSHVCDPTLLLDREGLRGVESVSEDEKFRKSNYMMVYVLPSQSTEEIKEYILKLRNKTGLPVKVVNLRCQFSVDGAEYLGEKIGPAEFLSCIKNARYCVTNSFHGMVFSSLYHCPFTAFQRIPGGRDFRQSNLVAMLGLQRRLVDNISGRGDPYDDEVDWRMVDKIRKENIVRSIQFIQCNL